MSSLLEALFAVHELLDAHGVPHALCGGLAANLYRAEPRATTDVDLSIVVRPAKLAALVDACRAAGWTAEPYWRRAELLRLSHADRPRVDCLLATTDYEESAVRRAATVTVDGRALRVLTREDLIVFKLIAGRARDYEAVAAILNTDSSGLDVSYITGWLEQFEMSERWGRALEEALREAEE